MTATKKRNWNTVLKDLIKNYNNSIHNSIKIAPVQVLDNKQEI